MNHCTNCGHKAGGGAFCGNCGAPLREPEPTPAPVTPAAPSTPPPTPPVPLVSPVSPVSPAVPPVPPTAPVSAPPGRSPVRPPVPTAAVPGAAERRGPRRKALLIGVCVAAVVAAGVATALAVTSGSGGSGDASAAPKPGGPTSAPAKSAAPAAPPNAGDFVLENVDDHTLTIRHLDGTATTVRLPAAPGTLYSVPAGVPGAGTVYELTDTNQPGEAPADLRTVVRIAPDGTPTTIPLDGLPVVAAVAPAGTPHAGTVYLAVRTTTDVPGWVRAISPDGTTRKYDVGMGPCAMAVAPQGTPHAGTVYVSNCGTSSADHAFPTGGSLTAISPDGTVRQIPAGPYAGQVLIAPAGTPAAGTVYLLNMGDKAADHTITVVHTDGSVEKVPLPLAPQNAVMVPAGTPNAGTLYVDGGSAADQRKQLIFGYGPTGGTSTLPPGYLRAVAPAGTPAAGSVYVERSAGNDRTSLVAVTPSGSEKTVLGGLTGTNSLKVAVSPAGTPTAGTLYVSTYDGDEFHVVPPSGSDTTLHLSGTQVTTTVVPPGTANAGWAYVVVSPNNSGATDPAKGVLTIVKPDGTADASVLGTDTGDNQIVVPAAGGSMSRPW